MKRKGDEKNSKKENTSLWEEILGYSSCSFQEEFRHNYENIENVFAKTVFHSAGHLLTVRFTLKKFKKLLNQQHKIKHRKHFFCMCKLLGYFVTSLFPIFPRFTVPCLIIEEYHGPIFCHCPWRSSYTPWIQQISLYVHVDYCFSVCAS